MTRTIPLTPDLITGEIQPCGYITGFPRPHIRSAWPSAIGVKLTNHKINEYAKKGRYYTKKETIGEKQKRASGPKINFD